MNPKPRSVKRAIFPVCISIRKIILINHFNYLKQGTQNKGLYDKFDLDFLTAYDLIGTIVTFEINDVNQIKNNI